MTNDDRARSSDRTSDRDRTHHKDYNKLYKTVMCVWYERGRCKKGMQCTFKHGPNDSGRSESSADSGRVRDRARERDVTWEPSRTSKSRGSRARSSQGRGDRNRVNHKSGTRHASQQNFDSEQLKVAQVMNVTVMIVISYEVEQVTHHVIDIHIGMSKS